MISEEIKNNSASVIWKKLRKASLNLNFTASYIKRSIMGIISFADVAVLFHISIVSL